MKKVIGRFTLALLLMCLGGLLLAKNFISFNIFTSVTFILGITLIFFGLEFIYYSTKKDIEYGLSGGALVAIILISIISISSAGVYNVVNGVIGGHLFTINGVNLDDTKRDLDLGEISIDLSGVSNIINIGSDSLTQTTNLDYTIDTGYENLTIQNKYGDITIIGEDREDIQVYLVIKEYNGQQLTETSKNLIKELGKNDYIYYQQQGSSLTIKTVAPMQRINNRPYKYEVDYELRVPKETTLDVSNKYGLVKVDGLTKDVTAENGYKDLMVYNITGNVDLTNGYGPIEGENLVGDVNIVQKYDEVNLTNIDGNLNLENKYGKLKLKNLTGQGSFDIGYSSISVENCPSSLDFNLAYSSLDLGASPDVRITSKHTPMTIDNQNVALKNVEITSEYGDVTLKVPSDTQGRFKLESRYGTIRSDLPLSIATSTNTKRVEQQIGTDNIDIDITNKYADISIKD